MSDKRKFTSDIAFQVASELFEKLRPKCEPGFIVIAGSLRREKKLVGDIELLFVPRLETRPKDFFTTEPYDLAAEEIGRMLADGTLEKRPSTTGIFTWGKLNKLAIHVKSGIPVDLFSEPDVRDWFRSLVIRTGPKGLNIELMDTAPKNGYRAHAYGEALHKISTGERVFANSEEEFFKYCGVRYREPRDR